MSALVLPSHAARRTRRAVTEALHQVPDLCRFVDTPGLLAAICLEARRRKGMERRRYLERASRISHRQLTRVLWLPSVSILRKMTGDALNESCLAALQRLTGDSQAVRMLRHARAASALLILALDCPTVRKHTTAHFFAQIGALPSHWRPPFYQLEELACFLSEYRPHVSIQSKTHFRTLSRRYDRLMGAERYALREPPEFPSPPWPGEPGYATPLTEWRDLIRESLEMHNCVGEEPSFLANIQAGKTYFYRVEEAWGLPRTTLYVERHKDIWRIREARAACNQPLSRPLLGSLALWIAMQQGLDDEKRCLPATDCYY